MSGVSSQRGTLPWTAPEILRTPEAVTEKADVFRRAARLLRCAAKGLLDQSVGPAAPASTPAQPHPPVTSFAVVMWELWTGQEPFAGMNYLALMMRLANPRERLRPPVPGTSYWEGEWGQPRLQHSPVHAQPATACCDR